MEENIKPLTPNDISINDVLPSYVIEAVNDFIKKRYIGKSFVFTQDELIQKIISLAPALDELTRDKIFSKKYLDIESIYDSNGWHVLYDRPNRGESFEPYFKFTPKK